MKKLYRSFIAFIFAFTMNAQDSMQVNLVEKLETYVSGLENEFELISEERKAQLKELAGLIREEESSKLNFICTHNSRRSQLAQIWATVGAYYYGIEGIETFSGGTEATAFNPRAVKAIKRAGFNVKSKGDKNPTYRVYYTADRPPLRCFSKKYGDSFNPQSDFIAVMVCSDADENCPFVDGAKARLAIPYIDPKVSDGTFLEKETYDGRCRQIAREMFYLMAQASGSEEEAATDSAE